jgi:cytochrome c-type biogenesis protein
MSPAGVAVAFAAGLVSFLAPCVLPLVPGYLSAVSSVEADRLGEPGAAGRIVLSSLPFVAGLVSVFVLLGAGAAAIGLSIAENQFLLEQIAGFVLIVFGLVFMGLLPWPERLLGAGLVQGARRRGSGFLLGGAFAVCAAPCIGTVLASILVLASSSGTIAKGVALLAAYSLGLGAAFVAVGLAFARAMGAFRWVRDHYRVLTVVSGVTLVSLGLLLFFNRSWWLTSALDELMTKIGLGTL